MPSFKPFCIVLCLLCATLPARAEKPNDNRSNDSSQRVNSGYIKEWGGKRFDEWRKDLKYNADPSYRAAALMALLYFNTQAADAVPDVVAKLREEHDASPRVKAAMVLRMIPHHETDRPRIIRGLAYAISHDPQSIIRYEAARSLQTFCPLHFDVREERDALQDLVAGMRSTSTYELRDACIFTLMLAGVDPKTGPDPHVTDALLDHANPTFEPTAQVRLKAIMALGAQGRPQDPGKLQRVMGILRLPANYNSRSHPAVRIWSRVAIIALEEKVNKKELESIAGYLTDREAAIRQEAVRALGALEDKAQDYIDAIIKMLKKPEQVPTVRATAALSLGRMKNTSSRVLDQLIKLTEEKERENIEVVLSACYAFVMLGVNNAEVMKAMDKVLEHESLEKYQKDSVRKMIEELQNPRKKPAKNAVNSPEQEIAPAKGANKQKVNRR
jgi:HEAT repeat protein